MARAFVSRSTCLSFLAFIVLFAPIHFIFEVLPRFYSPEKVVSSICGSTPSSGLLSYLDNLDDALNLLGNLMENSSFGVAQFGHGPGAVYVLAQCAGYLDRVGCFSCHEKSRSFLWSSCHPPVGRFFLDSCFLRADSYRFFNETVSAGDASSCGGTRLDSGLGEFVRGKVTGVVNRAVQGGGYAFESGQSSEGGTIFVMAQCWRSLDEAGCRECLAGAVAKADGCIPSTEFRVTSAGCVLRYSSSDFSKQDVLLSRAWLQVQYIENMFASVALFFFLFLYIVALALLGKHLYVTCCRKTIKWVSKGKGNAMSQGIDLSIVAKDLMFKQSVLVKATDSFSKANKLGQGGFGDVYKGRLPDGREVAVKRLFVRANGRGQEIYNEISIISRAQHKNLVSFLGYSLSGDESLLVYEFLPNTSLDRILFDTEKKKELTWKKRQEIVLGTAEGLEYLHKRCEYKIIHRDIKASNILLDENLRPKIADFGLARLFSSDNSHISTSIAGTLGYMAPEYIGHGQLSEKVDVYSFGVLVLEIISGTRNNSFDRLDGDTLVSKAWNLYRSALLPQLIDESVESSNPDEVSRLAIVGLLCTQEVPALRPCMSLLVGMLRYKDFHLPTPSKPPFVHSFSIGDVSEQSDTPFNPNGFSIGDVCEKSDTPLNPNVSFSSLDCSEMYPR
ncbi:cysteine-rich receptor-like protein kinase 2 [Nymphaea colorata]|nr:cysteine-rich receptor-like protein kinase 2 [Nymphaea colorata]